MKDTSKKLLEATKDIWAEYYTHPFTCGIGDESLDIEKLKFYMIQDYLYLIDYAKVFAIGVAKSDDMAAAQRFAKALDLIYNSEMDIHRSYMKRLGISLEEAENTKTSIDNVFLHRLHSGSKLKHVNGVESRLQEYGTVHILSLPLFECKLPGE